MTRKHRLIGGALVYFHYVWPILRTISRAVSHDWVGTDGAVNYEITGVKLIDPTDIPSPEARTTGASGIGSIVPTQEHLATAQPYFFVSSLP